MDIKHELEEKGYCIVEDVLNEEELEFAIQSFYTWLNANQKMKEAHNKTSPHGIFKFHKAGHTQHAWYIRTRPRVQEVFKTLWDTDELVVSYDGACWISKSVKKKDSIWTHTDQAPCKEGLRCYQGFVALTSNKKRTLVVYEGSHKLHQQYAKDRNLTSTKDWLLIEHDYLQEIQHLKRVLEVKAGSLVLWDSRTFHQNQYGTEPEDRIVQYVSFLPKSGRSKKMKEKRMKYFLEQRTTSHWAYPVKVNGLQPQTYGRNEFLIDYSEIENSKLDDMIDEIQKLI
jgi:ectoine hydroxylase-related dioxygenase (phytanoyl-CoA dioxygenase family)